MKCLKRYSLLAWIVCMSMTLGGPASADQLVAWGYNLDNDINNLPAGANYIEVAAGDSHGLARASDGTVVAWGRNREGQCDVPSGTYKAIGAGGYFSLAIRSDGSIAVWGDDKAHQVSNAPSGTDFTAVDGGLIFAVALKSDGSIVAWGDDSKGQVSQTPTGTGFTAVAAGDYHAVALRSDGCIVSWGDPAAAAGIPTAGGFTRIDAGGVHGVAIAGDGSLAWWGTDSRSCGLSGVPAGNDYVSVSTGLFHALAVKQDGSVVGWGAGPEYGTYPNLGQADPPMRKDFRELAAGLYFSVGLTAGAGTENPAVTSDNFDDNSKASTWQLEGNDLSQCWMEECNQRLELRATAGSLGYSAQYKSNGWQIDPSDDFEMRVDFHYDMALGNSAALAVVLEPTGATSANQRLEFGAGSGNSAAYYWYSVTDGEAVSTKQNDRTVGDGVLYLSYDHLTDALYLSDVGYGSTHAWATVKGFLSGRWGGKPIAVSLMGSSDRLPIESGQAYFDNFVLEKASSTTTNQPSNVYRFWSPVNDQHFYTISEGEKTKLIEKYSKVWVYEGVAFTAASAQFNSSLAPVYRFWSPSKGSHFYTISESEKDSFAAQTETWVFEGPAFYAYPDGSQSTDSKPVYRFIRRADGSYFYTASEGERTKLTTRLAGMYTADGIAFYTYVK